MEEPQRRQKTVLSNQLSSSTAACEVSSPTSSVAASNLRDLLTVRQEEDLQPLCTYRSSSVSLGTVLTFEKVKSSPAGITRATSSAANIPTGSRTLLDIIRDEQESSGARDYIIGSSNSVHRVNWRAFKDRLRIRRASNIWQSTGSGGRGVDNHPDDISPAESPSGNHPPEASLPSSEEPETATEVPNGGPSPPPIRMSLMALLEQTDSHGDGPGVAVSALLEADEDEEEEDTEEAEEAEEAKEDSGSGDDGGGKIYVKCCVCMVRHKGAAFIPCGHTFCRLCSRELWVSRGNCPLCNGFILEILDIF
ncbi:unnamed protein product [Spirodela intermedia]|uniref:RING-type domain-containing protein n=1 Tax=Spirodela intermedia TaxID=51605 RepID=A0A7I8L662_SPIIN|nr:unnamed protein product [Spirodela intermedia]